MAETTRTVLMKGMPTLRRLFAAVDLQVTGYSDDQIAAVMQQLYPCALEMWPTPSELRRALQELRRQYP